MSISWTTKADHSPDPSVPWIRYRHEIPATGSPLIKIHPPKPIALIKRMHIQQIGAKLPRASLRDHEVLNSRRNAGDVKAREFNVV